MSLIIADKLRKGWSDRYVLTDVSATLAPAQRVGLVGPNGCGKTTLLRIMAGLETPTDGVVQRKSGLRIGYLPQDPPALAGTTLRGALLDVFAHLHSLEGQLHELARQVELAPGESSRRLLERLGQVQHEFELSGGYSHVHRIERVLTGLGFEKSSWDQPLAELSGGQRTRAYLARLLLEEPEVLLLDEPTNHLDLAAVEWLEEFLAQFEGAVLVVSHDRYFLDRATQWTWELDGGRLEAYRGSYTHYAAQRQERLAQREAQWQARREFVERTEEYIRRNIAGQRSSQAKGRRTRLARMLAQDPLEAPRRDKSIHLNLKASRRTGDMVLQVRELAAGYDAQRPLVRIDRQDVLRGQRLAIVGPNGCGKTTLVRTILGELAPLAGLAKLGAGVEIGYLSQTHSELPADVSAIDALRQVQPLMSVEAARDMLGALLLGGDEAMHHVSRLSGGQRSRVALARLMLRRPSVLVLDEPTNHLDIGSQEVLQDVLGDFDGTVLFVSHDRYLIDALATDVWAIDDGQVHALQGGWGKYLQWRAANSRTSADGDDPGRTLRKREHKDRRRRTNELQRLQRRLAQVEAEIGADEATLKTLHQQIDQASAAGEVERIASLGEQYVAIDKRLKELMEQWELASLELQEFERDAGEE
jgi:ATP-binding cassette subfamily F protein 3